MTLWSICLLNDTSHSVDVVDISHNAAKELIFSEETTFFVKLL